MPVLDLESGKLLRTLNTDLWHCCRGGAVPGGHLLALADYAKDEKEHSRIELWDTRTWRRIASMPGNIGSTAHMQFSPDGTLLASGGPMDGLRLWDIRTGRQLWWLHQPDSGKLFDLGDETNCSGLAFLPDGSALLTLTDTGPDKNVVQFRTPRTGESLKRDRAEP